MVAFTAETDLKSNTCGAKMCIDAKHTTVHNSFITIPGSNMSLVFMSAASKIIAIIL